MSSSRGSVRNRRPETSRPRGSRGLRSRPARRGAATRRIVRSRRTPPRPGAPDGRHPRRPAPGLAERGRPPGAARARRLDDRRLVVQRRDQRARVPAQRRRLGRHRAGLPARSRRARRAVPRIARRPLPAPARAARDGRDARCADGGDRRARLDRRPARRDPDPDGGDRDHRHDVLARTASDAAGPRARGRGAHLGERRLVDGRVDRQHHRPGARRPRARRVRRDARVPDPGRRLRALGARGHARAPAGAGGRRGGVGRRGRGRREGGGRRASRDARGDCRDRPDRRPARAGRPRQRAGDRGGRAQRADGGRRVAAPARGRQRRRPAAGGDRRRRPARRGARARALAASAADDDVLDRPRRLGRADRGAGDRAVDRARARDVRVRRRGQHAGRRLRDLAPAARDARAAARARVRGARERDHRQRRARRDHGARAAALRQRAGDARRGRRVPADRGRDAVAAPATPRRAGAGRAPGRRSCAATRSSRRCRCR